MTLSRASQALALSGAATMALSVAAGLWVLGSPRSSTQPPTHWRLDFAYSLAGFADTARVARCAWIVSGDVTDSSEAAVSAISKDVAKAQAKSCGWYIDFLEYREKSIFWKRVDSSTVELCGPMVRQRGDGIQIPLAREYTFPQIGETPVQEGPRCYTIDVANSLPDKYGHP